MKNIASNLITIVIPSKIIDSNLKNCVSKIRKFYNSIEIYLVLDEKNQKIFTKY